MTVNKEMKNSGVRVLLRGNRVKAYGIIIMSPALSITQISVKTFLQALHQIQGHDI